MQIIREPARDVPLCAEVDVCVLGGSCTGVFAAVRAARLGRSVALVEQFGQLGGTATARMVCIWHSLFDAGANRLITAGLTREVMDRLKRRGVVEELERPSADKQFTFVPAELACELDELVSEHPRIRLFLHARASTAMLDADGRIDAVVLEDAGGRRAIRARTFVDATGDAAIALRAGLPVEAARDDLQPPTTAALLAGVSDWRRRHPGRDPGREVFDTSVPGHLEHGFLWRAPLPGHAELELFYGTRVHGVDCSDPDHLTRAEVEGRRQVRRIVDLLNRQHAEGPSVALVGLPTALGVRETRHARCLHRLTTQEVLDGVPCADAIANGSYRVDIHHQGGAGLTFRYLDGREEVLIPGQPRSTGRWREARAVDPTFYQIPYRSLVPVGSRNLWVAGRCLDAEAGAYGGVRVMVVCNQLGEAAGTAAALAAEDGTAPADLDPQRVRASLAAGGSVMI